MLLAVEGGGFFSASGYSKGLTLLFSGHKDGDRPMRVVPWNQYQVVDQEPDDTLLQLDSIKNRVSRGCASLSCFGGTSAGLEKTIPSLLTVEPVQQQQLREVVSSPEQSVDVVVSEKGKDQISEADDNVSSTKEAFKLSLRSSLKRPSVAESRSLEDIKGNETLSVDDMARRKVQWPDACGSELTQVREFEPSEIGLSDEEWEMGRQRTCSCVIM